MGTEFSASSNSFEWFYQARVVLYAGGYSSNELIFNAKGSNKHNWFGFNRLKNEPWSDIQTESLTLSLSLQFPNMATALLSTACTVDVLRMMNGWWQQNRSESQRNCLPLEQMNNISKFKPNNLENKSNNQFQRLWSTLLVAYNSSHHQNEYYVRTSISLEREDLNFLGLLWNRIKDGSI